MKIRISEIKKYCDIFFTEDFSFETMGMTNCGRSNTLAFANNEKYFDEALRNDNIVAIVTKKEIADTEHGEKKHLILCENPLETFYDIHEHWVRLKSVKKENQIAESARIHDTAVISEYNVVIEENVLIEENVVIKDDVFIGRNSVIRSNSVVGCESYEVRNIRGKNKMIKHDGKTIIENDVEVQTLCCVDKGLMGRDTIIGEYTKVGHLSIIGHGVHIGKNCLITPTVAFAGSVTVGDNVFVGARAIINSGLVIGDNAFIGIASVVLRDVKENGKVFGYPAQPR